MCNNSEKCVRQGLESLRVFCIWLQIHNLIFDLFKQNGGLYNPVTISYDEGTGCGTDGISIYFGESLIHLIHDVRIVCANSQDNIYDLI